MILFAVLYGYEICSVTQRKSINPGFLGTQLPIHRIKIAGANSWPLTLRLKDVFNSLTTKTNLH
jgi:hypothetical protein